MMLAKNRFRGKRFQLFVNLLRPRKDEVVLDLGCGEGEYLPLCLGQEYKIVGLDFSFRKVKMFCDKYPKFSGIVGDGKNLPFKGNSFDVIFSNSTIEHFGDKVAQAAFAEEVMRVGKRIFVQILNRYFSLEPHTFIPFFQFFPRKNFKFGLQSIFLWGIMGEGGFCVIP